MLQNLRRYFYDNKMKIIRNVLIVVFFILIIQGTNYLVEKQSGLNENNNILINNDYTYGNLINFGNTTNVNNTISSNTITSENIIISNNIVGNNGHNTDSSESTNNSSTTKYEDKIYEYLDLCIAGNIEQAYNLLSEDCKNVLFPTIEKFEKNYYSKLFSNDKVYEIEQYYGNTYKVKIAQDMNFTGSYTTLANTEYITVRYIDGEYKINVNNYIGRFNINKTSTDNDITIKVNYKDVFMEYEKYNITVSNGSNKIIKLNGYNSTDTMYLTDHNDNKYYAYINEIVESSLIMRSGSIVDFSIKYNSSYSEYTNSKDKLVFSNIILDYETYRNLEDKANYKDIGVLRVEI